jgi:hypothetical protein
MLLKPLACATFLFAGTARAGDGADHAHHNHIALFGGATIHDGHFYPSLGLDYEYLFHEKAGAVGLAEVVLADHTETIIGAGPAFHPIPAVKIAAIPALVMADGENAFLLRGNLEYAIHAGPLTVSPSVSVDYVHEEVLYVAGLAVGMGF